MNSSGPPTLVDFVEDYFGVSTEVVLDALARHDVGVLSDAKDFSQLLDEQRPDGRGPALTPGELRPVISHSIADIAAGGIQLEDDTLASANQSEGSSVFALDVRSLLLYAHTVSIADPFGQAVSLVGPVGTASLAAEAVTSSRVRYGIEVVCRLAPLIRSRVVFVAPPVSAPTAADVERVEAAFEQLIPQLAVDLARSGPLTFSDQTDLFLRTRTIVERFLRQEDLLTVLTSERATRLIACAAEGAALPSLVALRSQPNTEVSDPWTLSELMRLKLQGAGRIRLSDMVSIRDDAAFTVFRRDMADAVANSASRAEGFDSLAQAAVIAEEMRGAAERLHLETRRSVVLSSTLGDGMSWTVGAVAGAAIDGWRGAALGLIAKGVTELVLTGPSRPSRALRNHYVEMSKPVEVSVDENARSRLRRRRLEGGA